MIVPLILLIVATLSAAVAVYGTMPQWSLLNNGLEIIEMTRRLQWPLLTLSVLMCLTLVVLVIVGKRKVWWLVGFAPLLALFAQIFVTGTFTNMRAVDGPPTVQASQASFMKDEEYVVGVVADEQAYALPYRQLFNHPIIALPMREQRVLVFWSAFANRAMAFRVGRQVIPRELEVVSMPSNALLVYNRRVGQFINGVTGLTPDGHLPGGFHERIATTKTTWAQWRARYPQTLAMAMVSQGNAPAGPVQPRYPMKVDKLQLTMPRDAQVLVFPTTRPVALPEEMVTPEPLNLVPGEQPVMVFRDPVTGRARAFERKLEGKTTRFLANPSKMRAAKGVFMLDVATNSGWTTAGIAVDGEEEVIGKRLQPFPIEEGLYYGVMREWYPEMEIVQP